MIENQSQSDSRPAVKIFRRASNKKHGTIDLKKLQRNSKSHQFNRKLERIWKNQASRLCNVNWKLRTYGHEAKVKINGKIISNNVTYWASSSGLEFFRAILQTSWCPIVLIGIGQFINLVILRILLPFFQILLIQHFFNSKEPQLFVVNEFSKLIQCFVLVIIINLIINRCTSFAILGERTIKQLVNIFEDEIENFDEVVENFNNLWIIPIQIITVWVIMTVLFGFISMVPILIFLCLFTPVLLLLQYSAMIMQKRVLEFTEKRVEVLTELISAIRTVKLWAWEIPLERVVSTTRLMEIETVRKIQNILSLSSGFINLSDKLVIFVLIIMNLKFNFMFESKFIFTVFLYSLVLKDSFMNIFPRAVKKISAALHSCKKIQDFLLLDEIKEFPNGEDHSNFQSIELKKISAALIRNLSLTINSGDLCVIMGGQNSGKSSLIRLILQEIPTRSGNFLFHDDENNSKPFFFSNLRISYASQQPWIFSGSIRENIVFQEDFHSEKYFQVLRHCALARDISQFFEGDRTIVGKNGKTLTVRQATKINFARAVYKNADIYLFDDPLGPLDASTRSYIFEKTIKKLLFDKTRILTSRPVQIFSSVNSIVFLNFEGTIVGKDYQDIMRKSSKFACLMEKLEEVENKKNDHDSFDLSSIPMSFDTDAIKSNEDENQKNDTLKEDESLIQVLKKYFFQSTLFLMSIFMLMIFILTQTIITMMECSLGFWINEENLKSLTTANYSLTNFEKKEMLTTFSPSVAEKLPTSTSTMDFYVLLVAVSVILIFLCTFFSTYLTIRASETLHDFGFKMLLQTQLKYFNSLSSDVISELFGNDLVQVDQELPKCLLKILQKIFLLISILFMIIFIIPWVILPAAFAIFIFLSILKLYVNALQTIKNSTSKMKAELINQISEALNGLLTIRSGGILRIEKLSNKLERYQETYTIARNFGLMTFSTYEIYLDCMTGVFITFVCFLMTLLGKDHFLGGTVALVLAQITMLMVLIHPLTLETIQFIERLSILKKMTIFENWPREKSEGHHPSPSWPSRGRITIKDVSIKKRDHDQPYTQNLNVVFEHGWKVGVVDESEIGKNVLIDLLFRLNINESLGEVKIDGRNIKSINLCDLRSRISIVPRDPIFFKGSLRYNMNPFGLYTDQLLCDALRAVGLREISLDTVMIEGGRNLTLGQRQLVSLAIAIVKDNRILVIEEASSDIDELANSLIQKTLKTKFTTHTVITLAHCLSSIIENDRIMMMDNGTLVEFGCPHELLCDQPEGYFATLVNRNGGKNADDLLRRAEAACRQNTNEYSLELISSSSSSPTCSNSK